MSVVEVARGQTVKLFPLLIKFNQAPTNLKGSAPFAIHEVSPNVFEKISKPCVLKSGVPTSTSPVPCLVVSRRREAGHHLEHRQRPLAVLAIRLGTPWPVAV